MTTAKYTFTITAASQSEVDRVLLNILDKSDKSDLGFDFHVSVTDADDNLQRFYGEVSP